MRFSNSFLAGSLALVMTGLSPAQETTAEAKPARSPRIVKMLRALRDAPSLHFTSESKSRGPRRAGSNAIQGTCEGPLTMWRRKDTTLASRSGIWTTSVDGEWIAGRQPIGPMRNTYLADPRFLAERLLACKGAKWQLVAENVDDKVVRTYRLDLDKALLNRLLACGALSTAGSSANTFVLLGGGAGFPASKKTDGTGVVRVYEDPKNRGMIGKIVADVFLKNDNGNGGAVFLGGAGVFRVRAAGGVVGGKKPDDEKDAKSKGKKKPTVSIELSLRGFGAAKAELPDAARTILQPRRVDRDAGQGGSSGK